VHLIFAMVGANEQGTWVKGSVAPVLASEAARLFPGSPTAWPGTHWKLKLHGSRRDPKYPRRTLVGETLGPWRGG